MTTTTFQPLFVQVKRNIINTVGNKRTYDRWAAIRSSAIEAESSSQRDTADAMVRVLESRSTQQKLSNFKTESLPALAEAFMKTQFSLRLFLSDGRSSS